MATEHIWSSCLPLEHSRRQISHYDYPRATVQTDLAPAPARNTLPLTLLLCRLGPLATTRAEGARCSQKASATVSYAPLRNRKQQTALLEKGHTSSKFCPAPVGRTSPQVIPWPARSTNLQSAWKNLHTNEVSSWHDDTEIAVDELRIWPGINLQQKWALHDLTLILNSFGERGLRPELRPGKWAQRLLITGCGCLDTGERHCRGEKPKQTSPGRFMNGPKFKE